MRLNYIGAFGAAIAVAVTLAGCAALSAIGVSKPTVATVHLDTGKALAMAYDVVDAAGDFVEPFAKSGTLRGPAAKKVAEDLREAKSLLDTIRDAYHAGIASDPTAAINQVLALVADAKTVATSGLTAPPAPTQP